MLQSVIKLRLTKTRMAVIVLLISIPVAYFLLGKHKSSPEAVLEQIQMMRQKGCDLDEVQNHLGKAHGFSMCSSSGISPPALRYYRSSSWLFIRNHTPVNCEIFMITVYAMGDGQIVDVDIQTEIIKGLNAWKCLWYRVTGRIGEAHSMTSLKIKEPY